MTKVIGLEALAAEGEDGLEMRDLVRARKEPRVVGMGSEDIVAEWET